MKPLEAMQAALAGEHAAVYVYGVIGGRVSLATQPTLAHKVRTAYTVHRGRRDQLVAMVRVADGEPVAAGTSYDLPDPATTPPQLTRASLDVEMRCSAVYADMVGSTSGANRQWAIEALSDTAVRQLGFGGEPQPFPGISEL